MENARQFQKNIYLCFIDYIKAFDCVDHNKLWKILQEMGIQTTLPVSWETFMQVKKQQLYSISFKGFLPTAVDTMVIWIKFVYSSPF